MITVKRGKEKTAVELDGNLGDLMYESVLVVDAIRDHIIDNIEDPGELIFRYVDALIDAAWGKE